MSSIQRKQITDNPQIFNQTGKWQRYKVTVSPADQPYHFSKTCSESIYDAYNYLKNTMAAFCCRRNFDDLPSLPDAQKHNSVVRDTVLITDPCINEAILEASVRNGDMYGRGLNHKIVVSITGENNL